MLVNIYILTEGPHGLELPSGRGGLIFYCGMSQLIGLLFMMMCNAYCVMFSTNIDKSEMCSKPYMALLMFIYSTSFLNGSCTVLMKMVEVACCIKYNS